MDNRETSISSGVIVAFGFIFLGILNLFARQAYRLTSVRITSRFSGILFILIGVTILLVRYLRVKQK